MRSPRFRKRAHRQRRRPGRLLGAQRRRRRGRATGRVFAAVPTGRPVILGEPVRAGLGCSSARCRTCPSAAAPGNPCLSWRGWGTHPLLQPSPL